MGILNRVIVSPAVYPRFLEIAELARSLCHSIVRTRFMGMTISHFGQVGLLQNTENLCLEETALAFVTPKFS